MTRWWLPGALLALVWCPAALSAPEDWTWNGEGGDQSPLSDWMYGDPQTYRVLLSVYNTPSSLDTHPALGTYIRGGPIGLLYEEQGYEGGPGGSQAYPTYQITWWRAMLGWNGAFRVPGWDAPWRYGVYGGVIRGSDFWFANGDQPDISSAIGMGLTSAIGLEMPFKSVCVRIVADDLGFVNWGHIALGDQLQDERYTQILNPRVTVGESYDTPIARMLTEETAFFTPFGGRIRQQFTWSLAHLFAPRIGLGLAGTQGQPILPEIEGGIGLGLDPFVFNVGATWYPDFPGQRAVNRLLVGLTAGGGF